MDYLSDENFVADAFGDYDSSDFYIESSSEGSEIENCRGRQKKKKRNIQQKNMTNETEEDNIVGELGNIIKKTNKRKLKKEKE